jgi:2-phospho-L-lactate transferase/gluconeogenesis factor (CofD/UPF0052 family)
VLASRRAVGELFDYWFTGTGKLRDHAVGNLIIAALTDMAGSLCDGVEKATTLLRIEGHVHPAATECVTLVVAYADGTVTRGGKCA